MNVSMIIADLWVLNWQFKSPKIIRPELQGKCLKTSATCSSFKNGDCLVVQISRLLYSVASPLIKGFLHWPINIYECVLQTTNGNTVSESSKFKARNWKNYYCLRTYDWTRLNFSAYWIFTTKLHEMIQLPGSRRAWIWIWFTAMSVSSWTTNRWSGWTSNGIIGWRRPTVTATLCSRRNSSWLTLTSLLKSNRYAAWRGNIGWHTVERFWHLGICN